METIEEKLGRATNYLHDIKVCSRRKLQGTRNHTFLLPGSWFEAKRGRREVSVPAARGAGDLRAGGRAGLVDGEREGGALFEAVGGAGAPGGGGGGGGGGG